MAKLGVGVVGVGTMGRRHAENLRHAVPQAHLVAVADADRGRAQRVATELEVEAFYDDIEPVLARKDIQAVVIATPASSTPPASRRRRRAASTSCAKSRSR